MYKRQATDRLDEIISVWPDQICHNQVLSLVKVVIPFLERMNLKEPIYKALSGVKIPTVPHIGWSRYSHEIQKSRDPTCCNQSTSPDLKKAEMGIQMARKRHTFYDAR